MIWRYKMIEETNLVNENTEQTDPALDFVNALEVGNFSSAKSLFDDMLADKVQSTLDAEKIAVAGQIFNGEEPYDTDVDDDYEEDEVEDSE